MRSMDADMAQERVDIVGAETRQILKHAWPDLVEISIADCGPTADQRAGRDIKVYFMNGGVLTIDMKYRDLLSTRYPDILLEYIHLYDNGEKSPGWVADRTKTCAYFAYVFKKDWVCHFMSREELQCVWNVHQHEWLNDFPTKVSESEHNGRKWKTYNCAVPIDKLFSVLSCRVSVNLLGII